MLTCKVLNLSMKLLLHQSSLLLQILAANIQDVLGMDTNILCQNLYNLYLLHFLLVCEVTLTQTSQWCLHTTAYIININYILSSSYEHSLAANTEHTVQIWHYLNNIWVKKNLLHRQHLSMR